MLKEVVQQGIEQNISLKKKFVELHNHVTYVLNGKQELPTSS
jgi:hypothetical protein